jgi:threonine dehydrogenase-like Zn-dependent dehydrogenase
MTRFDNRPNRAITRRGFIYRTAGAAMSAAVFPSICRASALGRNGAIAPGNRVTLGVIGCGPQGLGDMGNFLNEKDCQVVAVCDVKIDQLEQARNSVNRHYQNQDCRTYHDFREMVARADIDACLIATPDHWHVPAALVAVHSGKDVYVEKPLGLSLEDDQVLRSALRKKKRVFQFGTQQRSGRMFRFASELVRAAAQSASFGTLMSGHRAVHLAVRKKWFPFRLAGTTNGGWGRLPSRPIHKTVAPLMDKRKRGGSLRTTLWVSSPAGAFIQWTSRSGERAI